MLLRDTIRLFRGLGDSIPPLILRLFLVTILPAAFGGETGVLTAVGDPDLLFSRNPF